jgi:hypothetical protein
MQARRRVWVQRLLHRFFLNSLALFGSVHASAALASIADAGASDNRPDLQQDAGMVAMSGVPLADWAGLGNVAASAQMMAGRHHLGEPADRAIEQAMLNTSAPLSPVA